MIWKRLLISRLIFWCIWELMALQEKKRNEINNEMVYIFFVFFCHFHCLTSIFCQFKETPKRLYILAKRDDVEKNHSQKHNRMRMNLHARIIRSNGYQ